jgi:hypothetical protein
MAGVLVADFKFLTAAFLDYCYFKHVNGLSNVAAASTLWLNVQSYPTVISIEFNSGNTTF